MLNTVTDCYPLTFRCICRLHNIYPKFVPKWRMKRPKEALLSQEENIFSAYTTPCISTVSCSSDTYVYFNYYSADTCLFSTQCIRFTQLVKCQSKMGCHDRAYKDKYTEITTRPEHTYI